MTKSGLKDTSVFSPIKVGNVTLSHRVAHLPLHDTEPPKTVLHPTYNSNTTRIDLRLLELCW